MARRNSSYRTKPRFRFVPAKEPLDPERCPPPRYPAVDHTPPPAPYSQAELLAARLEQLDLTYILHVTCRCGRTSLYPLRLLAVRHGRRWPLRQMIGRLRCKECRQPPATVHLGETVHREFCYAGRPGWSVLLSG